MPTAVGPRRLRAFERRARPLALGLSLGALLTIPVTAQPQTPTTAHARDVPILRRGEIIPRTGSGGSWSRGSWEGWTP